LNKEAVEIGGLIKKEFNISSKTVLKGLNNLKKEIKNESDQISNFKNS